MQKLRSSISARAEAAREVLKNGLHQTEVSYVRQLVMLGRIAEAADSVDQLHRSFRTTDRALRLIQECGEIRAAEREFKISRSALVSWLNGDLPDVILRCHSSFRGQHSNRLELPRPESRDGAYFLGAVAAVFSGRLLDSGRIEIMSADSSRVKPLHRVMSRLFPGSVRYHGIKKRSTIYVATSIFDEALAAHINSVTRGNSHIPWHYISSDHVLAAYLQGVFDVSKPIVPSRRGILQLNRTDARSLVAEWASALASLGIVPTGRFTEKVSTIVLGDKKSLEAFQEKIGFSDPNRQQSLTRMIDARANDRCSRPGTLHRSLQTKRAVLAAEMEGFPSPAAIYYCFNQLKLSPSVCRQVASSHTLASLLLGGHALPAPVRQEAPLPDLPSRFDVPEYESESVQAPSDGDRTKVEVDTINRELDNLIQRWPTLEFPGWTAEKVVKLAITAGLNISPGTMREIIAGRLPIASKIAYLEFLKRERATKGELLF